MEEKTNKTSEISEDKLNYFNFLSNQKGALMLAKSYKTFIKGYHDAYKQFREFIVNAESNFLNEEGLESYVIKSPFFQFVKEIKNILKVQREQFDLILENLIFTVKGKIPNLNSDLKLLLQYDET